MDAKGDDSGRLTEPPQYQKVLVGVRAVGGNDFRLAKLSRMGT